ncbi:hypothetical protein UFOVP125_10 [uncultured Caudovirales phage]|uniref:Uncharacterized protein n=1 Tax=uncultured Caudovirales phage TaxID=2100421 RepID=A0A6J5LFS4_9CAUD|nr:hypothetical protein UFOVP125_10 [uncultured Caudovirales phage]
MLTEDDLKEVLWACKSQDPSQPIDPKGLYCDNLDIVEFSAKIEEKVALKYARLERAECIKFVKSLNVEVARALSEKRGAM